MYTAQLAQEHANQSENELDERLKSAVSEANYRGLRSASIRVYIDDAFCSTIRQELEARGFTDIDVPDICLKGDVRFAW